MPPLLPAIQISSLRSNDGNIRASAALRLDEIIPLREPKRAEEFTPQAEAHQLGVSFIRTLALWKHTVLELKYSFLPNLAQPSAGKTEVHLVLHEIGGPGAVQSELLARFRTLAALLQAYFPNVVMAPVVRPEKLKAVLDAADSGFAWSVIRNNAKVNLTELDAAASVRPLGFTNQPDEPEKRNISSPNVFDYLLPWVPSMDTWRTIAEAMHARNVPSSLVIRLRPAARDIEGALNMIRQDIERCQTFQREYAGANAPLAEQARLYGHALNVRLADFKECAVNLAVILSSSAHLDPTLTAAVGEAVTLSVVSLSDRNDKRLGLFTSGGYDIAEVPFNQATDPEHFSDTHPYTASEAACAFRFPFPTSQQQHNLPVKLYKTSFATAIAPADTDAILGDNVHRGIRQEVRLPLPDRLRHTYLIGVTGSGKSTLLESMILQDIHAGRGVTFIDPHGETIERLIGKIPKSRIDDVILIDPLDYEYPVAFNLLACQNDFERDFVIGQLWEILDATYDMKATGGPIFEQAMRAFLNLLMGSDGKRETRPCAPTLMELSLAFADNGCRRRLMEGCDSEHLKNLVRLIEKAGGEGSLENLTPYIVSKFDRFVHDKAMARMIGQSANAVDFSKVLAERQIVLFKLGKGRFASPVCDILAATLVSRLINAVFARGSVKPDDRSEYFLYVDEFQNLVSETFGEMLAEVRKYKLGIVLAHQYTDQLVRQSSHTNLLPAVLGNVGTIISFRVGGNDAEKLTPSFSPTYEQLDLTNLPNFNAYLRTSLHGRLTPPFSLSTRPTESPYDPKIAEAVIEASRVKYGKPKERVDEEIAARHHWLRGENSENKKGDGEKEITLEDLFR